MYELLGACVTLYIQPSEGMFHFQPLRALPLVATTVVVVLLLPFKVDAADSIPSAVLIRMGNSGAVEVTPIVVQPNDETLKQPGLLIWSSQTGEHCQVLPLPEDKAVFPEQLAMGTRSPGVAPPEIGASDAIATVQLSQIRGLPRMRGGYFITPPSEATLLGPQITIRRRADAGPIEYPATELLLTKRREVLLRIPLEEGQSKVLWSDIKAMPDALKEGLTPGKYGLRTKDGVEETRFVVASGEIIQHTMSLPHQLLRISGSTEDPIYQLAVVQHLLTRVDSEGNPQPYLADALDLLESSSQHMSNHHLNQLREEIIAALSGKRNMIATDLSSDATGINFVDQARAFIAQGRWREATQVLERAPKESVRERGLALLYGAVILSESGATTADQSDKLFAEAIQQLNDSSPQDLIRAHNNCGNHLLGRIQDRLHNHSFQIASGVRQPLTQALLDWQEAARHYEAALAIAEKQAPPFSPSIEVNLARLHAVMADVIRTLDVPTSGQQQFAVGLAASESAARRYATKALEAEDNLTQAVGNDVLAQLAFRNHEWDSCEEFATASQRGYLGCGSLVGIENTQRLMGLINLERASAAVNAKADAVEWQNLALRSLQQSRVLAECLREQIPEDECGMSRAGFFARRAYVNDRIVQLLVMQDRHAEALMCAEEAKARALQDVLAAAAIGPSGRGGPKSLGEEMLANWPGDVAAVEYFLGDECARVFLVDTSGKVTSYPILDTSGRPIASRELVSRIHRLLSQQFPPPPMTCAKAMAARLRSGQGLDHTWQYDFHDFGKVLLPEPVVQSLREAKTVIIVPHHILHYFPFAALVTEIDTTERGKMEMVEPQFLVDEAFSISYAPSLTSWFLLRQRPSEPLSQVNVLGIADFGPMNSLEGVSKDLDNVQAIFGDRINTLAVNEGATESTAKDLFQRPGVLFVATHGANYADRPLTSCLMAQPDTQNDGRLTAGELFNHESSADVVILSACYSGLADRSPLPGDDLFGLERAILHSGAHSVVSGQWDVYDGTAPDLMREFLSGIRGGQGVPSALADSQRKFLALERQSQAQKFYLHPYFWAMFKATGDDRPIQWQQP